MISIIDEMYCFDIYEYLVEELTFTCIEKFGKTFFDQLNNFFESDMEKTFFVDTYYDSSYSVLLEEAPSWSETIKKLEGLKNEDDIFNRGKISADFLKQHMEDEIKKQKTKKPGLISRAISKLGKTKVGRAISRGVKRAVYGSSIGKKLLQTKANMQRKVGESDRLLGTEHFDKAQKLAVVAAADQKMAPAALFASRHLGKEAVKAGLLGKKNITAADKQERKLHLLSRISLKNITPKKATVVKPYTSTFHPKLAPAPA